MNIWAIAAEIGDKCHRLDSIIYTNKSTFGGTILSTKQKQVSKVIEQKAASPPHTNLCTIHILYNGQPMSPSKMLLFMAISGPRSNTRFI